LAKEEGRVEYWNRKWGLREQRLGEKVTLDGGDGEKEFDGELLKRVRGNEVLDIGCGPGEFTILVAQSAKSEVGIDPSEIARKLAKLNLAGSRLKNVTFRDGNAERLPFPKGSFDLV
jgi:ubiquinone/menaquinone biosynthesis C-methylase UbiE